MDALTVSARWASGAVRRSAASAAQGREAEDLVGLLNPDFAKLYAMVKRTEYEEFLQVISPWEREHLLLNV